ncbi:MAG: BrnT family toxin [Candidatus Omnitrophota bacterium]
MASTSKWRRECFYRNIGSKKSPSADEDRWLATGIFERRRITVVFTMRKGRWRIISARRSRRNE